MAVSQYEERYAEQARLVCRLGGTDADLAEFFQVTRATLNNWKWQHPDFAKALYLAKNEADDRVEQALYHRAVGYTFDSEKIMTRSIGDGCSEIVRVPIKEHIPPDTVACIFWLKNRRRDSWRDKWEIEQVENLKIVVEGGLPDALPATKQLELQANPEPQEPEPGGLFSEPASE